VLVALPFLIGFGLMQARHEQTLWDTSLFWVDEVHYWHQAKSFRAVGFDNGYYTYNEVPAPMAWTRYYAWGPAIPMLYGTLSLISGLSLNTLPVLNLALLSVALLAFVLLARPSLAALGLASLTLATFSSFIIYLPTSLLPILELALAVVLAVLCYRVITHTLPLSVALVAIVGFSFVRPLWAMLALPLLWLTLPRRRWLAVVLGVGILIAMWLIFYALSAPYPSLFGKALALLRQDTGAGVQAFSQHIQRNLSQIGEGSVVEVHMRQHVALTIFITLMISVWAFLRRKQVSPRVAYGVSACVLLLTTFAIAVNVGLYEVRDWRDYRIFAPIMLFSAWLILQTPYRWLALVLVASMVYALPETLKVYDIWTKYHVDDEREALYDAWQKELAPVLAYEAGAPNGWCNTLTHSESFLFGVPALLIAVGEGIGLSSFDPATPPEAFKARWLFFDEGWLNNHPERIAKLEERLVTPYGRLYFNPASACPA
jgi:hypothetical protein